MGRGLTGNVRGGGGAVGRRDERRNEPMRKRWQFQVDCKLSPLGEPDGGPDGYRSPVNGKKGALCCFRAEKGTGFAAA
jgi:hypothetical protein